MDLQLQVFYAAHARRVFHVNWRDYSSAKSKVKILISAVIAACVSSSICLDQRIPRKWIQLAPTSTRMYGWMIPMKKVIEKNCMRFFEQEIKLI